MSLSAGRAGVRHDQVDTFGRVTSQSFLNELLDCLPEWTDMPVYKGGTEEILPSNTAVPTTSPIVADIKYPDGMRQNQVFTYRETPAKVDGLAKIKSIKGNTLVWNQLCNNSFGKSNLDFTLSGNELTFDFTSSTNTNWWQYQIYSTLEYNAVANHVYYVSFWLKSDYAMGNIVFNGDRSVSTGESSGGYTKRYALFTNATTNTTRFYLRPLNSITANTHYENIYLKNIQIFDLTQMFGTGNEPTIEEFRSLYPLPFYSYNSGTLVNFSGNAIKTVGFNQWDEEWEVGTINAQGQPVGDMNNIRSKNFNDILPNTTYYCVCPTSLLVYFYDGGQTFISGAIDVKNRTFTTPSNARYLKLRTGGYGGTYNNDICVNISSSRNGEYEPYTETITDLPISTYFPEGMKSAGDVYDELTPVKATTRVGAVDLGTLEYTYEPQNTRFYTSGIASVIKRQGQYDLPNIIVPNYTVRYVYQISAENNMSVGVSHSSGAVFLSNASYTDAAAFKAAMSGVYLNYELATPVELPTIELGE